jgi:hypothetical protein
MSVGATQWVIHVSVGCYRYCSEHLAQHCRYVLEHCHAWTTFILHPPVVHLLVNWANYLTGSLDIGWLLADVAKHAGLPKNHTQYLPELLFVSRLEHTMSIVLCPVVVVVKMYAAACTKTCLAWKEYWRKGASAHRWTNHGHKVSHAGDPGLTLNGTTTATAHSILWRRSVATMSLFVS